MNNLKKVWNMLKINNKESINKNHLSHLADFGH